MFDVVVADPRCNRLLRGPKHGPAVGSGEHLEGRAVVKEGDKQPHIMIEALQHWELLDDLRDEFCVRDVRPVCDLDRDFSAEALCICMQATWRRVSQLSPLW